jgi:hypothetical protein
MVVLFRRITLMNAILIVVSVGLGLLVTRNPILLGRKVSDLPSDFKAYSSHPVLDRVLQEHRSVLGDDYASYRNHCLRVLSFASFFLKENATESAIDLIAYGLAYHDLGLWTDKVLNYLEPSSRRMKQETKDRLHETDEMLQDTEAKILQSFNNVKDLATLEELIVQHHKYTAWKAPKGSPVDENIVNAVRKADWADVTKGVVRYDLTAGHIESAYEKIPEANFHRMQFDMLGRLSPHSLLGRLKLLNTFKW